jgi:hypothetical protein
MNASDMPDDVKKLIQDAIDANPELVEQYGNPLDDKDPSFWKPSRRREEGMSVEDRLLYLEKDVEASTRVLGELVFWKMDEEKRRLRERIAEAKTDPQKAMALLNEILGDDLASQLPAAITDDNGNTLAGSVVGRKGSETIETPQGFIKISDIPGYRDDPEWRPSPDWVDANCMCPRHQQQRQANGFNEDPPNGMYL